jgi:hypothetical protein
LAIRQESPEFKWRKTSTFKKAVNRLWQVELRICEAEIPHFCVDVGGLKNTAEGGGESAWASRDVLWDELDEAVAEWTELTSTDTVSETKKKLREIKLLIAKLDKERKHLEEAKKLAGMKADVRAVRLYSDVCKVRSATSTTPACP